MNIKDHILELIRRTATDLPEDVEEKLREAYQNEKDGSAAKEALGTIIENVDIARTNSTPICQDTGTPIFFVQHPEHMSTKIIRDQICQAVEEATSNAYLRPNSVDSLTGRNSGNNLGDAFFPSTHFEPHVDDTLTIELILKGGGCENVGRQYALPDSNLQAGRDLEGVRRAALDAVYRAQGKGCAPGVLGISIGGDRGSSYIGSKEVLLRKIGDENKVNELAAL